MDSNSNWFGKTRASQHFWALVLQHSGYVAEGLSGMLAARAAR
jgi:hypothetical protein